MILIIIGRVIQNRKVNYSFKMGTAGSIIYLISPILYYNGVRTMISLLDFMKLDIVWRTAFYMNFIVGHSTGKIIGTAEARKNGTGSMTTRFRSQTGLLTRTATTRCSPSSAHGTTQWRDRTGRLTHTGASYGLCPAPMPLPPLKRR